MIWVLIDEFVGTWRAASEMKNELKKRLIIKF